MKTRRSQLQMKDPSRASHSEAVGEQIDQFEEQIEIIRNWIDLLNSAIPEGTAIDTLPNAEVYQSLLVAIEELSVAGEELRQQNDQLIEGREMLEDNRHKYEELFEFAPDGYIVTDLYGKIEDANQAACRQFNMPKHFLLGKPITPLVARTHRQSFIDWLVSIRTGERGNLYLETRFVPRHREAIDVGITAGLIRSQKDVIGIRWLIRDINDRRKFETKLFESEMRFHAVFGEAEVGICLLSLKGDIQEANPAMLAVLDSTEQGLVDRSFFPFIHVDDLEGWKTTFNKLAKGKIDSSRLQVCLIGRNGAEISTRLAISLVRSVFGKPDYIILIVDNITDERRMEQELIDVEGRLTDAADNERMHLAQELHDGPLQDLYGIMYQLKMVSLGSVDQNAYVELDKAQEMLQETINQLRTTTGGLRPPTLAHFGLEQGIRSYVNTIAGMAPDLEIHLKLEDDRIVLSDRVRNALFRIFQQGMMNVVRHANAHRVDVRLSMGRTEILLEVKDDGVGFEIPKRWMAFVGDGHYGLVGAAERAVSIGGKLNVYSKPGQGTLMRVVAPRNAEDQVQKERLSVEISEQPKQTRVRKDQSKDEDQATDS